VAKRKEKVENEGLSEMMFTLEFHFCTDILGGGVKGFAKINDWDCVFLLTLPVCIAYKIQFNEGYFLGHHLKYFCDGFLCQKSVQKCFISFKLFFFVIFEILLKN